MAAKKKANRALREVISGANAEALLDLVQQLGLVDMVIGRVKAKVEETDIDDFLEDVGDYLKRNPDVLVVGLAAITVATGVVVYLNQRREWDGNERRGVPKPRVRRARTAAA